MENTHTQGFFPRQSCLHICPSPKLSFYKSVCQTCLSIGASIFLSVGPSACWQIDRETDGETQFQVKYLLPFFMDNQSTLEAYMNIYNINRDDRVIKGALSIQPLLLQVVTNTSTQLEDVRYGRGTWE